MHSIFQQFLKNYANFCPKLCNTSEELNILFDRFFKFLNSTIHEHTVDVIGTSSLLQKKHDFHQRTQNFNYKVLRQEKGYGAKRFVEKFPNKNGLCRLWITCWRRMIKPALSIVNPAQEKHARCALHKTGSLVCLSKLTFLVDLLCCLYV